MEERTGRPKRYVKNPSLKIKENEIRHLKNEMKLGMINNHIWDKTGVLGNK